MANTLKILYWLHKSKSNKNGDAPLLVRLTYQKSRAEKATGFYINSKEWNADKQRVKGDKQSAQQINNWIDSSSARLWDLYKASLQRNDVHLPTLLNQLFTKPVDDPTLLSTIEEHNTSMMERVGNDFTQSTYEKYMIMGNKIQCFIQHKYGKRDVYLRDLNVRFIMEFDHYLRTVDKNQHNTAVKYCLNLKKIINLAVLQGKMSSNPFVSYRTSYKDTPQVYLEAHEVRIIEQARLCKRNHLLVRDLFCFQTMTGLGYTDLITLKPTEIITDAQGRRWIVKSRQKTGVLSTIPLLPGADQILEKYPAVMNGVVNIFPHYSIQKYNQYLGEIADLVGIKCKLPLFSDHWDLEFFVF